MSYKVRCLLRIMALSMLMGFAASLPMVFSVVFARYEFYFYTGTKSKSFYTRGPWTVIFSLF